MKRSVEKRWNSFVVKSAECWLWTGSKTTQGYGQFVVKSKSQLAHKVGWRLYGNPAPGKGFALKNQCGNKICVNPAHWEILSIYRNLTRPAAKTREDKLEEFANKINENGPLILDTPCWEWLGSKDKKGNGHFSSRYFSTVAHRTSWEIFNGQIPLDHCVGRRCSNPSCVNPEHLFLSGATDEPPKDANNRFSKRVPVL